MATKDTAKKTASKTTKPAKATAPEAVTEIETTPAPDVPVAAPVKKSAAKSKKAENETESAPEKTLAEVVAAAPKKQKIKSPLSAKQIEHFSQLLLSERARLEEEREQIRSRAGAVDGALPEEGEGGDEDTADLANAMMDKEMDLSVEDEIEDLLSAVDHALQKIQDGTYGICDMSGEPIPAGRLELIPYAALTVECQAISEG